MSESEEIQTPELEPLPSGVAPVEEYGDEGITEEDLDRYIPL